MLVGEGSENENWISFGRCLLRIFRAGQPPIRSASFARGTVRGRQFSPPFAISTPTLNHDGCLCRACSFQSTWPRRSGVKSSRREFGPDGAA